MIRRPRGERRPERTPVEVRYDYVLESPFTFESCETPAHPYDVSAVGRDSGRRRFRRTHVDQPGGQGIRERSVAIDTAARGRCQHAQR